MYSLWVFFTYDGFRMDSLWKSPEVKTALRIYDDNPWIFVLALNGLERRTLYDDDGLSFLKSLSDIFWSAAEKENGIPAFSHELYTRIEASKPRYESTVNEQWCERAWKNMQEEFEKVWTRFDHQIEPTANFFTLQFSLENTLQCHILDSHQSDHPFDLQIFYTSKEGNRIVEKPLGELLHSTDKFDNKKRAALKPLMKLAQNDSFIARALYDGTLLEKVPLNAAQGYIYLQNHRIQSSQDTIRWWIPKWWREKSSSGFHIQAKLSGQDERSLFNAQSLIAMRPSLIINGEEVDEAELDKMAEMEDGLHYINGQWMEISNKEIQRMLDRMHSYQKGDLTLFDALRLQSGLSKKRDDSDLDFDDVTISNDEWLENWMHQLKHPQTDKSLKIPDTIQGSLFPYQQTGYSWLEMMRQVNLGACLADDMGLGKTLQLITLLEHVRQENPDMRSLAIVPASLLINWKKEAEKFAPSLAVEILHGKKSEELAEQAKRSKANLFITTYTMARKLDFLKNMSWDYLILDEAQAIKNPTAKQTKACKMIPARHKVALTGTPIENDLSNLWSIFDFLNKGLLGSYDEFKDAVRRMNQDDAQYTRLHELVSPFLLRRLKTDKSIISDLPDKIEKVEYISLSKRQTALYLKEIKNLEAMLNDKSMSQIARSGRVLSALTHFKQICNHPDQYLGKKDYKPADSGKFEVLRDICETIRENHESVLVFTQYTELIPYLNAYLTDVFGAEGLVIHGQTPVSQRQERVDAFNAQKTYIPYMILSLKAGGTGLNLTQASHVIHFDRWWNPAVENQATDRAYRIGQNKNVVVHKFITTGTIEEHIDKLIESKKELAEQVIGSGANTWISEMDDQQLLKLVSLS